MGVGAVSWMNGGVDVRKARDKISKFRQAGTRGLADDGNEALDGDRREMARKKRR